MADKSPNKKTKRDSGHPPFTSENAAEFSKTAQEHIAQNKRIRHALLRELYKVVTDPETGERKLQLDLLAESAVIQARHNPKYWELVRDTIGEKPVDSQNVTHELGPNAVIRVGYDKHDD